MKRMVAAAVAVLAMAGMGIARAQYTWEYAEGKKATFGADIRLRYDHADQNVFDPNGLAEAGQPASREWLRVRERVWGKLDLAQDLSLSMRLVNRWQKYNRNAGDPNDRHDATWEFPDETIFDQFYLDAKNVADSNWSLRLGRQDIALGNGMVVLEGTPFDQGRTIYFDGLVAQYKSESDTLTLFGVYNTYRDRTVVISDQERRLRYGDTGAAGAYWTHNFTSKVNTDLYYIYAEVDDDRNPPPDFNAKLNIFGGRVFGDLTEQVYYSLEAAKEMGQITENGLDVDATMIDARLNLKAAEGTMWAPVLKLEATYFSGDDPGSADEVEGWFPLFDNYPIWREELMPIMLGAGGPSNLTQYRAELVGTPAESLMASASYSWLVADHGEVGTGGGNSIGQLLTALVEWKATKKLTLSAEVSYLIAGDYFGSGHDSEWARLQTVYVF